MFMYLGIAHAPTGTDLQPAMGVLSLLMMQ